MKLKHIFLGLLAAVAAPLAAQEMPTLTGERFLDTDGNHINAHGGNIIKCDSIYYWYGEHRPDGKTSRFQKGVSCYSSPDLHTWTNRGIVLESVADPNSPIQIGSIIERPKVVYCPATGKYVMWFHNELKGQGYGAAQAGVATSPSPTGPFTLVRSSRVNPGKAPLNLTAKQLKKKHSPRLEWWTPKWRKAVGDGLFTARDLEGGQMARDMTLYVDPASGKAYHIYSSEENLTLQIAELDSTFERHTGRYIRVAPGGHNEAPAIFRHGGKYWMITSGCTGWAPNAARLLSADSIMGEWTPHPNPCRGPKSETTFGGQSTYVMELDGKYTFMADQWNPKQLGDSRHLWLPIRFDEKGVPFISMAPEEKDMSAYLLVYFNDPTHSLFFATSPDGYEFTAINDAKPIIAGDTIAQQRGIRDPHILRGPDGAFYLCMTDLHVFGQEAGIRNTRWERGDEYGWGNNRNLVLMKSYDLIHWTHSIVNVAELFPDKFGDIGCAWAPETTYDPASGRIMIYFTMRHRNGPTRMFYSFADADFTTLTEEPKLLFDYPNEKTQVLDADIIQLPDGRWCMSYVAQENPSGIKIAMADAITGPYEYQPEWVDAEPKSCEAPNIWKRIGQDKWVVMYDCFRINPHNFGFVETSDFKTFTPLGHFNDGVMKTTNFTTPKHGAVIHITAEEKARLDAYKK